MDQKITVGALRKILSDELITSVPNHFEVVFRWAGEDGHEECRSFAISREERLDGEDNTGRLVFEVQR